MYNRTQIRCVQTYALLEDSSYSTCIIVANNLSLSQNAVRDSRRFDRSHPVAGATCSVLSSQGTNYDRVKRRFDRSHPVADVTCSMLSSQGTFS